jgi:hypothetical protein
MGDNELQALRDVLYRALSGDWEISAGGYRKVARAVLDAGYVPLADVLDALEEEGRLAAWRLTPDAADVYSRAMTMLAERFTPTTAPEGADERNGHG